MSAEVVRINQENECSVVSFPVKDDIKLTKDGKAKKTPNNTKENRDNVQPIKEEDIPKIVKYYKSRIDNAKSMSNELSARRDLTIFIAGINISLRVSDLITLRWSDIYENDWTFKSGKVIKPKKTANHNKHVLLKFNNDFKSVIEYYRHYCGEIKDMDSYIFTGSVNGHISDATVDYSLKQAAKAVGIKYPIATHSLRKTFSRLRYDHAEDKSKVLVELMVLLAHSSVSVTKHYICISEEEIEELYNSVSIGFDAIFKKDCVEIH